MTRRAGLVLGDEQLVVQELGATSASRFSGFTHTPDATRNEPTGSPEQA